MKTFYENGRFYMRTPGGQKLIVEERACKTCGKKYHCCKQSSGKYCNTKCRPKRKETPKSLFAYTIGDSIGDLKITGLSRNKYGRSVYVCQCVCGNMVDKKSSELTYQEKLHCGCKHSASWTSTLHHGKV